MSVYRTIRSRREELGMTQQELAVAVGYKSRSAINKIELGLRDISQGQIEAFASALKTTPAELMGWNVVQRPKCETAADRPPRAISKGGRKKVAMRLTKDNPDRSVLGNYIKECRTKKNLSLRECGKLCGISHTHIDSIEKGIDFRSGKQVNVSTDVLAKLAAGLNLDVLRLAALSITNKKDYECPPNSSELLSALPIDKQFIIDFNRLSPEEQKMIHAQIKGLLLSRE